MSTTKTIVPLAIPDELQAEIRRTAADTDLSQQDVVRQSITIGLAKVREQHSPAGGLKPFTKAEARAAFGPDPEWDRLEALLARRSVIQPEAD